MQIAAAHALAQLCQSNHANQELVADEGGLETVSEILQVSWLLVATWDSGLQVVMHDTDARLGTLGTRAHGVQVLCEVYDASACKDGG